MPDNLITLGRALTATNGPLTQRTASGKLLAVRPEGGAYPPHELGVGSTRGGKTSTLRYVCTQRVRRTRPPLQHLADGKYSGAFKFLRDLPGVVAVANTGDEIAEMVLGFHEQTELAYEQLDQAKETAAKTRGRAPWETPPVQYLVLDEYLNWALSLGEKQRKDVIAKLVRVGSIGGEVNMRLSIWTQRPDSAKSVEAGLPGLLKAQLKCRLAATGIIGMDKLEAHMAFDDAGAKDRLKGYADASGLKDRRGLGMIQMGDYEVAYKTPWMADPLHPETTDEDREAAWRLLPAPVGSELP
jgi:hypothetical protein